MRTLKLVLLLGVLATAVAGCGGSAGGTGSEGATPPPPSTEPPSSAEPPSADPPTSTELPFTEPAVGEALSQFVEAAGAADAEGMWSLLSLRSRARLGPDVEDFAAGYVPVFRDGVGTFAGTSYEVVLAVETLTGWGVAAIAGDRVQDGEQEYATYAAALRREGEAWKLELEAPIALKRLEPDGTSTSEALPRFVVQIEAESPIEEAGLWLDGKPFPADAASTDARLIQLEAVPESALALGRHSIVVFGRAGNFAAAGSAPLTVTEAASG